MSEWIEVSLGKFYDVIGPQNVTPYPVGDYPYTSEFRTPSGIVRGKVIKKDSLNAYIYLLPLPEPPTEQEEK